MRKRTFAVLIALTIGSLCFVSLLTGAVETSKDFKSLLAPLSPEFVKYRENARRGMAPSRTLENGGRLLGGVPSPTDLSYRKAGEDENVETSTFPTTYDLRNWGHVPPVRDQGGYPTCWTFGAMTSLESCLMPEMYPNFSEWHLAITHGYDYEMEDAGNSYMSTAYFIRWSGPLEETIVPYASGTALGDHYTPARHVQQAVFLPERQNGLDNDTIKYFIMTYGAVEFAYMWENEWYNNTNASIYKPNNRGENHRLGIIGWDDEFPSYRFVAAPPGPGAFLIRNSWGSDFGQAGYCWVSYYDESIQQIISFNNAEDPGNYGHNYQYDPLGKTRAWGNPVSWGGNIFTAINNNPLEAVGFYVNDSHVNYEIQVYKHVSGANPTAGVLTAVKSGTQIYAGFYTVRLEQQIPLARGEKFSVVVKFTNPVKKHSVPIEAPIEGYSSQATANRGESFVSLDGVAWTDLMDVVDNSNVCIKAYSQFKASMISLSVNRERASGWLISREFADITVRLDNLDEVPVSRVEIQVSVQGNDFQRLVEFTPADLVDGSYTFSQKYIERGLRYTYRAVAYAPEGFVAGQSTAVII